MPSLVKINLGLDLINHFNKKIKELKANDNVANNAHIYAMKSFIKTIENELNK
jgi:hypothetical protein